MVGYIVYRCTYCNLVLEELDECDVVYNKSDDGEAEIDAIYFPLCGEEMVME